MGSLPLGHLNSSKGKQLLVNPLLGTKLHMRYFRVLDRHIGNRPLEQVRPRYYQTGRVGIFTVSESKLSACQKGSKVSGLPPGSSSWWGPSIDLCCW